MKTILGVLVFLFVAGSAMAQVEVAKGDTLPATQATRVRIGVNSAGQLGQKGSTGFFQRFATISEVLAAAGGGVQQVNGVSPTGGNVNVTYATLMGKPTTVSGFGITDAVSTGGTYTNPAWLVSIPFSKITAAPTTIAGFGITDGVSTTGTYANPTWLSNLAFSKITSTPTTLAGYGITDAALSVNVIPVTPVANYAAISGVTVPGAGFVKFVKVATDTRYTDTNTLYLLDETGKYRKLSLLPSEN